MCRRYPWGSNAQDEEGGVSVCKVYPKHTIGGPEFLQRRGASGSGRKSKQDETSQRKKTDAFGDSSG